MASGKPQATLIGTLSLHPNGSFTDAPTHSFAGLASFAYKTNDSVADSNTATVTISVTAVEHKLCLPLAMRP